MKETMLRALRRLERKAARHSVYRSGSTWVADLRRLISSGEEGAHLKFKAIANQAAWSRRFLPTQRERGITKRGRRSRSGAITIDRQRRAASVLEQAIRIVAQHGGLEGLVGRGGDR